MKKTFCESSKKMQDICQNCKKLYFIRFKVFKENFCSLDCKSSYIYVKTKIQTRINDLIKEEEKQEEQEEQEEQEKIINDFSNTSFVSELSKKTFCESSKRIQDTCQNCQKLYFIRFKEFEENFCSLDCKSSYIYVKTEIQKRINDLIKEQEEEIINDFIDFSNTSFASELNKRTLKYNNIQSMDVIYNKEYNHTNVQITL